MKNITPLNQKNNAHGYWEWYWANDSILCKCFYNNGKEIGYEESYYYWSNKLRGKTYYI